jgi:hypothetical protein
MRDRVPNAIHIAIREQLCQRHLPGRRSVDRPTGCWHIARGNIRGNIQIV